jgi:hypothetical protein
MILTDLIISFLEKNISVLQHHTTMKSFTKILLFLSLSSIAAAAADGDAVQQDISAVKVGDDRKLAGIHAEHFVRKVQRNLEYNEDDEEEWDDDDEDYDEEEWDDDDNDDDERRDLQVDNGRALKKKYYKKKYGKKKYHKKKYGKKYSKKYY